MRFKVEKSTTTVATCVCPAGASGLEIERYKDMFKHVLEDCQINWDTIEPVLVTTQLTYYVLTATITLAKIEKC